MSTQRSKWYAFLILLAIAVAFRVSVAHWLANDTPDDAKVYSQLARNVLEQHVYADASEPPFVPVYIRTPGYPLFLAGIYSLFGHTNNGAVRIVQALIDSGTCVLVALFAYVSLEDEKRELSAFAAMSLAALNPFTTIYTATLLPEVLTTVLAMASCTLGLLALRADNPRRSLLWWAATGVTSGLGVMTRPDSGLFAFSVGVVLVVALILDRKRYWTSAILATLIFSITFAVVLVPWTLRNWRTFHVVQPLAPATATMPDEFVARGYSRWLSTWLDDQRYVDQLWWGLDDLAIPIGAIPDKAFDSVEERQRVAALLDKYNHPDGVTPEPGDTPQTTDQGTEKPPSNDPTAQPPESEEEETPEELADQAENNSTHQPVAMTPEIDAAFGQLAQERINRAPLRYYLWMPLKRATALWLNTHSDYYPFSGDLFPLNDLDYDIHQHIWLPLFAVLVAFYSLIGILGGIVLWISRGFYSRLALLLVCLVFITRLALFSRTESLESRYVVELFPFLAALGGLAIARVLHPPVSDES